MNIFVVVLDWLVVNSQVVTDSLFTLLAASQKCNSRIDHRFLRPAITPFVYRTL